MSAEKVTRQYEEVSSELEIPKTCLPWFAIIRHAAAVITGNDSSRNEFNDKR